MLSILKGEWRVGGRGSKGSGGGGGSGGKQYEILCDRLLCNLPNADGFIAAAADEGFAIGAEGDRVHRIAVPC